MCADDEEEAVYESSNTVKIFEKRSGRAQTQSRISKSSVAPPSERIKYALVKGKLIGVGGKWKQGPYNMCKERARSVTQIECA